MILAALGGLLQSLLYSLVLYYLGNILVDSKQLRSYLGLKNQDEQEEDFSKTSYWVENIGKVVMAIAIVSAIVSIITTATVLYRM